MRGAQSEHTTPVKATSPPVSSKEKRSSTGASPTGRAPINMSFGEGTPVKVEGEARRPKPEVEEKWRDASGLKSPDEILHGDFTCSYTGDLITSAGRFFLSNNHLCFYAALGALSMKKVLIPWLQVSAVEKTLTNYEHSSGIKITEKNSDTLRHFTQFSVRDKVYDLIMQLWSRALKRAGESVKIESTGTLSVASLESKEEFRESKTITLAAHRSLPLSPPSLSPTFDSAGKKTPLAFSGTLPKETSWIVGKNLSSCSHWNEPTTEPMQVINLPYSIDEFVSLFLDDNGAFFNSVHAANALGGPENCWIKPYPTTLNECCTSRDFNFEQPITTSFPLAPSATRVKQTHRWFYPKENCMYFSTSSMMPDIPYGASFSIESKWKVEAADEGASSVRVTVWIEGNFFKWLFGFRATVESLIKKDGTAYVQVLLDRMVAEGKRKTLLESGESSSLNSTKSAGEKLKKSPSFIKPAVIRKTPDMRPTCAPTQSLSNSLFFSPMILFGINIFLLILLLVGVVYIAVLHQRTSSLFVGSVQPQVLAKLRLELSSLHIQIENIEKMLALLE